MTVLAELTENHEAMPTWGYGLVAILVFLFMLGALVAIGRGRPDRQ